MLRSIGDDLWLCDGPVVRFMRFFPYPTRMAVVRLRDGGLWVWSPIALSEELVKEIESLGAVRHLVAPNALHHLSLAQWSERFPGAQLHAAPGLAAKRPDLCFQTELGDDPDPAWASEIDQVVFRGSFFLEEVVFFHRASRTALVADLIQRIEPEAEVLQGWRGLLMRIDGLAAPDGSTPREWRASFWNRRAARAAREKVLAWEPERLVIAHGACATERGSDVIRSALRWL